MRHVITVPAALLYSMTLIWAKKKKNKVFVECQRPEVEKAKVSYTEN